MFSLKKIAVVFCCTLTTHLGAMEGGDSLRRNTKKIVYDASLKAGYHYGFIQGYTFDGSFPDQLFLTEGNAGLKVFKLPFQVEYRYATMRIPYGLNNYFRIKFDADRYMRELEEKKQALQKLGKVNMDSLYSKRQDLIKKMYYRQYQMHEIKRRLQDKAGAHLPDTMSPPQIPDSLTYVIPPAELPDSLKFSVPGKPQVSNPMADSLNQIKEQFLQLQTQVNALNHTIDSIHNIKPPGLNDPATAYRDRLKKRREKAFKLNAFELGTCFPTNSYLMYGTLPVNGVFTDLEYQGVYFSFLYGEVVNNFLFANTFFERQLLSTKNVTNFFDFSSTNRGRKITAFKIGKGRFQDNHIHVGFLYGLGLKNYGDTTLINDMDLQPRQSNAVLELSSRYTFKKHQFEFALAKSVLTDHRSGALGQDLMQFKNTYSLAGVMIYSTSFFKERTRLRVLVRHLQPYFQSFGLGFMNGDYLRMNVKVDQKIGKKLTVGGFVRNDIDNLYNLVTLTNQILNYGLNTTFRLGRAWNIRLTYNPILQKVTDNTAGTVTQLKNYLYNANLSFHKRLGKTSLQSNVNYNYFQLNDFNGRLNTFQNITASHSVSFGKTNITLASTYFTTNIVDSLDKNNFMNSLIAGFNAGRINLRAGIKHFSNLAGTNDFGALLGCVVPLGKYFSLSVDAQKFVVGDYFLSASGMPPGKIPYCLSAAILVRFQ